MHIDNLFLVNKIKNILMKDPDHDIILLSYQHQFNLVNVNTTGMLFSVRTTCWRAYSSHHRLQLLQSAWGLNPQPEQSKFLNYSILDMKINMVIVRPLRVFQYFRWINFVYKYTDYRCTTFLSITMQFNLSLIYNKENCP